jgi:SAM-dependent methyltransferase
VATTARDYYDPEGLSAVFYDLICAVDPTVAADADFYAGLLDRPGWVLELGCGTGRIVFDLARRGHHVVGIDLAQPMIYRASLKFARQPPEVQRRVMLAQADMVDVEIRRAFDLVIVAYFSLAHLEPSRWDAAFENIARHLGPGGVAAVHLPVAKLMAASHARDDGAPVLSVDYSTKGEKLELYLISQSFQQGRFEQVLDYVMRDADGRELRRSRERLTYYNEDPRPHATAAGLLVDHEPSELGAGAVFLFRKP